MIEHTWREVLCENGLKDFHQIWQCRYGNRQRVYTKDGEIYKIIIKSSDVDKRNDKYGNILNEYKIIKYIEDFHFIPKSISFSNEKNYIISKYKYIENAKNLVDSNINYKVSLIIFIKSAFYLLKISARGICHNDIMPNNLLLRKDGSLYLVDFDCATRSSVSRALFCNFVKFPDHENRFHGGWTQLVKETIKLVWRKNRYRVAY